MQEEKMPPMNPPRISKEERANRYSLRRSMRISGAPINYGGLPHLCTPRVEPIVNVNSADDLVRISNFVKPGSKLLSISSTAKSQYHQIESSKIDHFQHRRRVESEEVKNMKARSRLTEPPDLLLLQSTC
jgi:hypothetical protein